MSNKAEETHFRFPVYGTQGGGLVQYTEGRAIFVEAPDPGTGLGVGDEMPAEWGVIPANEAARNESEVDSPFDRAMWGAEVDLLFETAFDKLEKGDMTIPQIASMFPQDVINRAKSAE